MLALILGMTMAAGAARAQEEEPRVAQERIVLQTTIGDLVIALFPDVAPQHVAQILTLVRMGVYDTTYFYRVDPGFLIQLANAQNRQITLSPDQLAAIHRINGEFSSLRHRRGIVTMARDEHDSNSAETSFSIMMADAPHLDGKYTIFGRLERGDDVLDAIANVDRDASNRPLEPVQVTRAEVVSSPALSRMALRAAIPRPSKRPQMLATMLFPWMCGVLIAFGLATFLFAGRFPSAVLGAQGLLAVLTGAFFLFIALVPRSRSNGWLSVLVFFGVVGLFKLMSLFERSR